MTDPLFCSGDLDPALRHHAGLAATAVQKIPPDRVLLTPAEDLVEELLTGYRSIPSSSIWRQPPRPAPAIGTLPFKVRGGVQ